MRNLTIKRNKSFVGCLATIQVYIEDPNQPDIVINGVPCRMLGALRNGQEATYQVGDQSARVFVVADALSRNYANDCYRLSEGHEDIYITGSNKLRVGLGNMLFFDNNDSEEAIAHHKQNNKKGWLLIIAVVIVSMAVGVIAAMTGLSTGGTSAPREFNDAGMSITLTGKFRKQAHSGFTVSYISDDVIMFGAEEKFSLLAGLEDYTLREYAEAIIEGNDIKDCRVNVTDGLTWFEYKEYVTSSKTDFVYKAFVFKTDEAFWLIQFAASEEQMPEYSEDILQWAKSISFE